VAIPTGQAADPRARQVDQLAADLDQKYPGRGFGAAFEAFAQAHPGLSAQVAFETWALQGLPAAIRKALTAGIGGVGTDTGELAAGTVKGLELPDFLGIITSRAFIVRALKVIIGAGLILVGLVEIGHPGQVLSKLPKVIPV
jgi:hypothetical protein